MKFVLFLLCSAALMAAPVTVHWDKVVRVSKTTATLQVVVNPPLRPGSKIHDRVYTDLRALGADYVRYVPWLPYPKLAVAELEPPAAGKTSWDFSLIDPMTIDFLNATAPHPVILNFSTIPQWMFKTPKPVTYPADPDKPVWNYTQGAQLRDPSLKELADYYARLISWYTAGGFTDEFGQEHKSGHHFKIDYWEVFNEIEFEHNTTPEQYTARYDAIVAAIHKVAPQMKFVALALASPTRGPHYFEYFLNAKNHKPGIPLDMISYHFYAVPQPDETMDLQEHTYWSAADGFLTGVRYIESIRQRLAPATRTTVDEIGSISAEDLGQGEPGFQFKPIPNSYWNLSGATYAYVFAQLAAMGIDIAGESQLVGYPTQFPSVSMVDWETGAPNARWRVLELLKNNFGPGDKLVATAGAPQYVHAQGFVTKDGKHKLLLINQRNRDIEVPLGASGTSAAVVDQTTKGAPARVEKLAGTSFRLPGFAVAVITLP
ncbi:MAG: glycosyl hydrolase family 39 [Bryobacteraceae bacterium]